MSISINHRVLIETKKFISDPDNHSPVGNPSAGRLRRLIRVQIRIRLMQAPDRKDRQQI
ncbi:MAG: hypothetical protein LBT09_11450 [Planctomycetaceae bacterium]|nr:hypothetical protein [Planctomycetaceae bacterium]